MMRCIICQVVYRLGIKLIEPLLFLSNSYLQTLSIIVHLIQSITLNLKND